MSARAIAWSPGAAGPLLEPETPWDWTLLADCQYTDPEAFFPEKGGSVREAKRICRGCPVRAECLEYALERGEKFGIWGGLSERERRAMASRKLRPVPGPRLCLNRLHPLAGVNLTGDGRCRECRNDARRTRRQKDDLAA